ncbi:Gti1/Pac2 family-domain-containing protein [Choanephora cucurbitarum]|uniref:cAMP-independent regulatory protein pac2 n=1 Tax=Choanephora cucurbitarum TaxID=101091 RepID=A0A1C7NJ63_9FUNG|nr:Gti1/Pac2 family-domain-containing protein [Choanephora cucurbitarum]OBZ89048.1 cAMP-independent regulatory protein pac2 [Choanephora cucurbitarum]
METYVGYIKTPQDALYVFEACRKGTLNRVQRRLTSKERINIRSGSVFAWDEREAGMRRWTDGRTWSPSRVLGSFLTYKELDTKRRPRRPSVAIPGSKQITFSYKQNGLIKQSFSICTATNQKIHLISYYTKADILSGRLQRPSHDPMLNTIEIPKGFYPELNPLDIGGGHPASIHSIQYHRHDSIDSSGSDVSTISSADEQQHPPSLSSISSQSSISTATFRSEDEFNDTLLLSPLQQHSSYSPLIKHTSFLLPAQDIAWEKLPSTEDSRQLKALRDLVRI